MISMCNNFIKILWIALVLAIGNYTSIGQIQSTQQAITQIEQDILLAKEYAADSELSQASFYFDKAANGYWQLGMHNEAIEQFEKACEIAQQLGNLNAQYIFCNSIGLIYAETKQYDKALAAFKKSTEIAKKLGRQLDVAQSYLNKANVYIEKNQYNEAQKLLDPALSIAQESQDIRLLRNIYLAYLQIYDKQGNIEESTKYFALSSTMTNKIQREEAKEREEAAKQLVDVATSKVRTIEAEKKAKEEELQQKGEELTQKQQILEETEKESIERLEQITLLDNEKMLQQQIIDAQKQMRKIYLAAIALALIFSGYLFYSLYQKKEANRLLSNKNEEIIKQNHEIQLQAEQLRELNNLKDKLFSIISHDLRSPLGSLVTMLNLNRQGYFSQEEFNEVINDLSKNVAYTSELLENLLNWAQSQMQGLKVAPKNFTLHPIVQSKIDLYSEPAQNKGIMLRNLVEENVVVYADSSMVELTLRNLIANAIKFCNRGDTITVLASMQNNQLLVSVSDTGIGMPLEKVQRLFGREIFTTRGTSDEKGSGLGLMLCKEFVTLNGGRIWAKSIEGVGSEFFFTIPVEAQS